MMYQVQRASPARRRPNDSRLPPEAGKPAASLPYLSDKTSRQAAKRQGRSWQSKFRYIVIFAPAKLLPPRRMRLHPDGNGLTRLRPQQTLCRAERSTARTSLQLPSSRVFNYPIRQGVYKPQIISFGPLNSRCGGFLLLIWWKPSNAERSRHSIGKGA
jgi:hypothetical protein